MRTDPLAPAFGSLRGQNPQPSEEVIMKSVVRVSLLVAALVLGSAGMASAWHLDGHVYCDASPLLPLAGIQVNVVNTGGGAPFSGSATTDADGFYFIPLPETPDSFLASLALAVDESVIAPASGDFAFATNAIDFAFTQNWVVSSPRCAERCWLTGGGAKFCQITGTDLGECKREHSWGGNVNPGCSPIAGQGGEWNDVAWALKLHFHGTAMHVVRCGNVDGIPAGSTSPATPFNFIEFTGTGTLKGIKGNKVDNGTVYFFARCEDRNEPGSNGQHDGAGKDRYFLHVYSNPADPAGSTLLLVDQDGDPTTVDPLIITDGNLQIHISSCDVPTASATPASGTSRLARSPGAEPEASVPSTDAWLAFASRNPTSDRSVVRFGLPRETDVSLVVYDVTGRMVRDVVRGPFSAGVHTTSWDLHDQAGQRVAGGLYFIRLRAGELVRTQRLIVEP